MIKIKSIQILPHIFNAPQVNTNAARYTDFSSESEKQEFFSCVPFCHNNFTFVVVVVFFNSYDTYFSFQKI